MYIVCYVPIIFNNKNYEKKTRVQLTIDRIIKSYNVYKIIHKHACVLIIYRIYGNYGNIIHNVIPVRF